MFGIYFAWSAVALLLTFGLPLAPMTRLLMMAPVGVGVFGVIAAFAFYLPELFPTHMVCNLTASRNPFRSMLTDSSESYGVWFHIQQRADNHCVRTFCSWAHQPAWLRSLGHHAFRGGPSCSWRHRGPPSVSRRDTQRCTSPSRGRRQRRRARERAHAVAFRWRHAQAERNNGVNMSRNFFISHVAFLTTRAFLLYRQLSVLCCSGKWQGSFVLSQVFVDDAECSQAGGFDADRVGLVLCGRHVVRASKASRKVGIDSNERAPAVANRRQPGLTLMSHRSDL